MFAINFNIFNTSSSKVANQTTAQYTIKCNTSKYSQQIIYKQSQHYIQQIWPTSFQRRKKYI